MTSIANPTAEINSWHEPGLINSTLGTNKLGSFSCCYTEVLLDSFKIKIFDY